MNFATKNMTVKQFLQQARKLENKKEMEKVFHRTFFSMLWSQCDTATIRVYSTIGHLCQSLLGSHNNTSAARKSLKNKTLVGKIKSKNNHHDDVPFICVLMDDQIYLLLGAECHDHGMVSVQEYDREEEMFIGTGYELSDFVLSHKVEIMNPEEAQVD